jgi:hypothetical protein
LPPRWDWSQGDFIGGDVAATIWAPSHQTMILKLEKRSPPVDGSWDPPRLRGSKATELELIGGADGGWQEKLIALDRLEIEAYWFSGWTYKTYFLKHKKKSIQQSKCPERFNFHDLKITTSKNMKIYKNNFETRKLVSYHQVVTMAGRRNCRGTWPRRSL